MNESLMRDAFKKPSRESATLDHLMRAMEELDQSPFEERRTLEEQVVQTIKTAPIKDVLDIFHAGKDEHHPLSGSL